MIDDIFIKHADQILPGPILGQKASSVMVGAGVSTWEADKRGEICGVNLTNCSASAVTIGPVILKDCRAENCKTTRHFAYFYGTAFSNCSFHGNCGRIWIEDASKLALSFTHLHEAILEANQAFYQGVDIAIDLTDAWFSDLEIRAVPLEKIATDPDRQIKCCTERAAAFCTIARDELVTEAGHFLLAAIDTCHENGDAEFLIANAKAGKARNRFLELKELCEANDLLL